VGYAKNQVLLTVLWRAPTEFLNLGTYCFFAIFNLFFTSEVGMKLITYEEFAQVELRSGAITKVEEFPRAKKLTYKVWADFGPEIGILQT